MDVVWLFARVSLSPELRRLRKRLPQAVPAKDMQEARVAAARADGVVGDVLEPLIRHPLALS